MVRGKKGNKNQIEANLGFEQALQLAAHKLRDRDAADYKHVVLGLIFLKYNSDVFQDCFNQLKAESYAGAALSKQE